MAIYKRPWKVVYGEGLEGDRYVERIVDANGAWIIQTDCGVYGPDIENAEFLVMAVNEYGGTPMHHFR